MVRTTRSREMLLLDEILTLEANLEGNLGRTRKNIYKLNQTFTS